MSERKLLTRDEVLAAQDIVTEYVAVPEWGGGVLVRSMTAAERDTYEGSLPTDGEGKDRKVRFDNLRARLCAAVMVDETGARLFSPEDVEALGHKSVSALDRVFEVASRLSALGQKDIETLLGNSASARNGVTSSV